jgi:hypothetical protein
MSTSTAILPSIEAISFLKNELLVALANDRTFIVPLDMFPAIAALTPVERIDFEIIDGTYLSFLSIDEIFSVNELIGI